MRVSGCPRRSLEPRTHVLFHVSTTYPHPHRPYCHFHDQNKERVSRGQVETGYATWSLASGEVLERQAWRTEEAQGAPLCSRQQRDPRQDTCHPLYGKLSQHTNIQETWIGKAPLSTGGRTGYGLDSYTCPRSLSGGRDHKAG